MRLRVLLGTTSSLGPRPPDGSVATVLGRLFRSLGVRTGLCEALDMASCCTGGPEFLSATMPNGPEMYKTPDGEQ